MDSNAASAGAHALAASAPAASAGGCTSVASDPAANSAAVSISVPAVSVSAPGKVNLFLALGAARPDGYHPLNTIFAQIGLSETVTVTPLPALTTTTSQPGPAPAAQTGSPRIELALTRPDSNVPLDHTNLAYRAAQAVAQQAAQRGLDTPDVHILLDKAVPVAGGMAGGSADAAATLKACNEFWQVGLSLEELAQLGAQLGADVPFGLYGGVALGTGRGDLIEPLKAAPGPYYWTFALQDEGLSTAAVFKHFDATVQAPPAADMPPEQLLAALEAGDVAEVSRHIRNDLQATAIELRPELGQLIDLAERAGALVAMVSGSGPTVAALSSSRAAAERVALCWSLTPFCDQVVTG